MKRLPINIYATANGYLVSAGNVHDAETTEIRVCNHQVGSNNGFSEQIGYAVRKIHAAIEDKSDG